jgi:hypothetical protein
MPCTTVLGGDQLLRALPLVRRRRQQQGRHAPLPKDELRIAIKDLTAASIWSATTVCPYGELAPFAFDLTETRIRGGWGCLTRGSRA